MVVVIIRRGMVTRLHGARIAINAGTLSLPSESALTRRLTLLGANFRVPDAAWLLNPAQLSVVQSLLPQRACSVKEGAFYIALTYYLY